MGPMNQLKRMCDKTRALATTLMLVSAKNKNKKSTPKRQNMLHKHEWTEFSKFRFIAKKILFSLRVQELVKGERIA